MKSFAYDAAVLVAADRNERRTWAAHRVRIQSGALPLVSAAVVAQVSRSPRQALLRRFLTSCVVVPFDEQAAHDGGRLLALSRTTDVVDASVVTLALRKNAVILTGDPEDIARLVSASGHDAVVVAV
jgi:predicted nucleic acid-binding protein